MSNHLGNLTEMIRESINYLKGKFQFVPEVGIVLGSGLGGIAKELEEAVFIPYKEIPHFPVPTVEGHAGRLVIGTLGGKSVAILQGRSHYYEGFSLAEVTFPIRVLKRWGVRYLIITNAVGAVNPKFRVGDLVIITDHINFMGENPLRGVRDSGMGCRFPDLSQAYHHELIGIAETMAGKVGIACRKGVYMAFAGPSYETPAEIKMARLLKADVVGMSLVPEVIVAHQENLSILAIACVSNKAAGLSRHSLSHEDITKVMKTTQGKLDKWLRAILCAL